MIFDDELRKQIRYGGARRKGWRKINRRILPDHCTIEYNCPLSVFDSKKLVKWKAYI
jgi:hypothetical protein